MDGDEKMTIRSPLPLPKGRCENAAITRTLHNRSVDTTTTNTTVTTDTDHDDDHHDDDHDTDLWAILGREKRDDTPIDTDHVPDPDPDHHFEMLGNLTSEELLLAYDKDEDDDDMLMMKEAGEHHCYYCPPPSSSSLLDRVTCGPPGDDGGVGEEGLDNPQAPNDTPTISATHPNITTTTTPTTVTAATCGTKHDKKKIIMKTTTPKRPLSAYNLFFKAFRAKLAQTNHPSLNFAQLGKEVARQWKRLPASKRTKYEIVARKDSLRYRTEMQAYKTQVIMDCHIRNSSSSDNNNNNNNNNSHDNDNDNDGPTLWLNPPPQYHTGGMRTICSQHVSCRPPHDGVGNATMVATATTSAANGTTEGAHQQRSSSSSDSSSRSVNTTTTTPTKFNSDEHRRSHHPQQQQHQEQSSWQDHIERPTVGTIDNFRDRDNPRGHPPIYNRRSGDEFDHYRVHHGHRYHRPDSMTHPYNLPLPIILRDPSEAPGPQGLPVPPGSIVTLPDPYGRPHEFVVSYRMQCMTHSQAASYVDEWSRNVMSPTSRPTTHTVAPWIVGAVPPGPLPYVNSTASMPPPPPLRPPYPHHLHLHSMATGPTTILLPQSAQPPPSSSSSPPSLTPPPPNGW